MSIFARHFLCCVIVAALWAPSTACDYSKDKIDEVHIAIFRFVDCENSARQVGAGADVPLAATAICDGDRDGAQCVGSGPGSSWHTEVVTNRKISEVAGGRACDCDDDGGFKFPRALLDDADAAKGMNRCHKFEDSNNIVNEVLVGKITLSSTAFSGEVRLDQGLHNVQVWATHSDRGDSDFCTEKGMFLTDLSLTTDASKLRLHCEKSGTYQPFRLTVNGVNLGSADLEVPDGDSDGSCCTKAKEHIFHNGRGNQVQVNGGTTQVKINLQRSVPSCCCGADSSTAELSVYPEFYLTMATHDSIIDMGAVSRVYFKVFDSTGLKWQDTDQVTIKEAEGAQFTNGEAESCQDPVGTEALHCGHFYHNKCVHPDNDNEVDSCKVHRTKDACESEPPCGWQTEPLAKTTGSFDVAVGDDSYDPKPLNQFCKLARANSDSVVLKDGSGLEAECELFYQSVESSESGQFRFELSVTGTSETWWDEPAEGRSGRTREETDFYTGFIAVRKDGYLDFTFQIIERFSNLVCEDVSVSHTILDRTSCQGEEACHDRVHKQIDVEYMYYDPDNDNRVPAGLSQQPDNGKKYREYDNEYDYFNSLNTGYYAIKLPPTSGFGENDCFESTSGNEFDFSVDSLGEMVELWFAERNDDQMTNVEQRACTCAGGKWNAQGPAAGQGYGLFTKLCCSGGTITGGTTPSTFNGVARLRIENVRLQDFNPSFFDVLQSQFPRQAGYRGGSRRYGALAHHNLIEQGATTDSNEEATGLSLLVSTSRPILLPTFHSVEDAWGGATTSGDDAPHDDISWTCETRLLLKAASSQTECKFTDEEKTKAAENAEGDGSLDEVTKRKNLEEICLSKRDESPEDREWPICRFYIANGNKAVCTARSYANCFGVQDGQVDAQVLNSRCEEAGHKCEDCKSPFDGRCKLVQKSHDSKLDDVGDDTVTPMSSDACKQLEVTAGEWLPYRTATPSTDSLDYVEDGRAGDGEGISRGRFRISDPTNEVEQGETLCDYAVVARGGAYSPRPEDWFLETPFDGTQGTQRYSVSRPRQVPSLCRFGIFLRRGLGVNGVAGKPPNRVPMFTFTFIETNVFSGATPDAISFQVKFRDDDAYEGGQADRTDTYTRLQIEMFVGPEDDPIDWQNGFRNGFGSNSQLTSPYCTFEDVELTTFSKGCEEFEECVPARCEGNDCESAQFDVTPRASPNQHVVEADCFSKKATTVSGSLGSAIAAAGDNCKVTGTIKCSRDDAIDVRFRLLDITRPETDEGDTRMTSIVPPEEKRRMTAAQTRHLEKPKVDNARRLEQTSQKPFGLDIGMQNGYLQASLGEGSTISASRAVADATGDAAPGAVGATQGGDDAGVLPDVDDAVSASAGSAGAGGAGGLQSNQAVYVVTNGQNNDTTIVSVIVGVAAAAVVLVLMGAVVKLLQRRRTRANEQAVVYPVMPSYGGGAVDESERVTRDSSLKRLAGEAPRVATVPGAMMM